jgi:hypothetical protein
LLQEILKQNISKLSVIYAIILAEMFIFSFLPYLTGLAIDDLLKQKYDMLFLYASALLTAIVFGTLRRLYDTRIFSSIYISKAKDIINTLKKSNLDGKRIISRYQLVGTYTDFFEFTFPTITNIFIGIAVAMFMIFYIKHSLLIIISIYVSLTIFIHAHSSKKSQKIEYQLQHTREDVAHGLAENQDCTNFLDTQRSLMVKKSDIESVNWCICDSLSTILDITTILIVCNSGLSIGEITAILLYTSKITEKTNAAFWFFTQIRILQMSDDLLKKSN